jgi:broad specificity phosphatase PhoE
MSGGDHHFRLLYLRHGETDLNRQHRMQGVPGVSLNDRGREQLRRAAERLAGEGISWIVASDLDRARESAEIVAGRLGLPVATDPRLREQDLGEWEEKSWPRLSEFSSEQEVERFLCDLDYAPPGGETKRSVLARVTECFEEVRAAHPGETVLAVSHGGPLLVFVYRVLGIPFSERNRFYGMNGSLTEFEVADGGWRVVSLNETHYLRDGRQGSEAVKQ